MQAAGPILNKNSKNRATCPASFVWVRRIAGAAESKRSCKKHQVYGLVTKSGSSEDESWGSITCHSHSETDIVKST